MTEEEYKELSLETEKEMEESYQTLLKMEQDGVVDIQKYFDRIHDKLFGLNNILIASYFALISLRMDVSNSVLLIPVLNTLILLYVDYLMLNRARIQAQITSVYEDKRKKFGTLGKEANKYSLISIFFTLTVLVVFGYILLT